MPASDWLVCQHMLLLITWCCFHATMHLDPICRVQKKLGYLGYAYLNWLSHLTLTLFPRSLWVNLDFVILCQNVLLTSPETFFEISSLITKILLFENQKPNAIWSQDSYILCTSYTKTKGTFFSSFKFEKLLSGWISFNKWRVMFSVNYALNDAVILNPMKPFWRKRISKCL